MNKIFSFLSKFEKDKYIHFIAGMLISIIFATFIPFGIYYCIIPAILISLCKEIYDRFTYGLFDYKDLLATILGGLFIQITELIKLFIK